MEQKIKELRKYLDRLSVDMGWHIIIADHYGALREYEEIYGYLSYSKWRVNPYCMRIKQDRSRHERCIQHHLETKRVIKRRGSADFDVCFCGVAEYSVPVFLGSSHAFTVFVTGFLAQMDDGEMELVSKDTGIAVSELERLRGEHLEPLTQQLCNRLDSYIGVVGTILCEMFRDMPLLKEQGESEGIKQKYVLLALDHIAKHYFEDITPKSVAARCNVSLSYLQHLFVEYTRDGVASAIRRKRMEHACELLSGTDASVRSIAIACGYYDTDYFSVVFKRTYGISPLKFRKARMEK